MRLRFFGALGSLALSVVAFSAPAYEPAPPALDARLYALAEAPSPARIEVDIQRLVAFGTRNTLSDTASETRGIGAARRFVRDEFERISAACGGCLRCACSAPSSPGIGPRAFPWTRRW